MSLTSTRRIHSPSSSAFSGRHPGWPPCPPTTPEKTPTLAAGRAVADRADVTIAIWDGHPAAGKGGTGDIVGYLRERRHPWIWLPADGGQAGPENLRKLAKTDWPGITDAELASWGKFNENRLDDGRRSAIIDQFRHSILKAGGADLAADLTVLLDWLQAPFARAELLSRKFQARYLHLSAMLFVLAALAVCIVGTQLVFFPHTRLVVAGEIACLVIILVGLEWGRRAHLQQRWISARYLAERLRSALFLGLAGAGELSSATALVSEDIPVAPWVGTAFEMTWMRRPQVDADRISVSSLRRFLSVAWIDDQQHYFKESAALSWRKYRFSSRAVEVLFATSVVIAIIHVALDGPENWIKHAVSLLAIGIPACAAALVGYYTQREYLRNSRRYDRMARSLASANRSCCARRITTRSGKLPAPWTRCSGKSAASGSARSACTTWSCPPDPAGSDAAAAGKPRFRHADLREKTEGGTDGVSAAPVYQGGLSAPLPIDGALMASAHSSDASSQDRSDQDAEREYRSSPHMIRTEATFSAVDR